MSMMPPQPGDPRVPYGAPPGYVPSPPPGGGAVRAPAIALMVVAILGLGFALCGLGSNLLRLAKPDLFNLDAFPLRLGPEFEQALRTPPGPFDFVMAALWLIAGVVILIGAIRMMQRRNYGLAVAASVLAMIPLSLWLCCCASIPVGIWALVVLLKPEVKATFT